MGKLLKNQRNPNDADYAPRSESNWTRGIYILHERKMLRRRSFFAIMMNSLLIKPTLVTENVVVS
jgi:hypothetical protein